MLGATDGHGIRELTGRTLLRRTAHGDVLDLDQTRRPPVVLQHHIDPRVRAIAHLAPQPGVPGHLRYGTPRDGASDDGVGPAGVDTDANALATHDLPRMRIFPLKIVA